MSYEIYEEIEKKISSNYYAGNHPLPERVIHIKPIISKNSKFYKDVMKEWEDDRERYNKELKQRRDRINSIDNEFNDDLKRFIMSKGIEESRALKIIELSTDYNRTEGRKAILEGVDEFCGMFKE